MDDRKRLIERLNEIANAKTRIQFLTHNTADTARAAALALDGMEGRPSAGKWQPIETADTSAMFARSEWVLLTVDSPIDGRRVTEGHPHYTGRSGGFPEFFWICARGGNAMDPRCPTSFLGDKAVAWMPRPEPYQDNISASIASGLPTHREAQSNE